jgi:hypothetical protein
MHSPNESSHHPQTRVRCPHVSTFDGPHDVVAVTLFDVEHHHVRELQGVKDNTPLPTALVNHRPPVPVLVADPSTVRPLPESCSNPSSRPAPLVGPPSVPLAGIFLGTNAN